MIQILCMHGLPFASRQNEMIEMALTFKFSGIEVDLDEMVRRADAMGQDFATQFVNSAKIEVASFKLPIDFGADDATYDAFKERLESICTIADAISAKRCFAVISPGSDRLAFQENFELHRNRITEIASRLAENSIRLGLAFNALASEKEKYQFQFICKAEELLALIKTVNHPNVGLAIDTFHWQLGDGGMDQVKELDVNNIVDVRLADLPAGYDPQTVTAQDRIPPGDGDSPFTTELLKYLDAENYDQTISVVSSFPDFNDRSRGVRTVEKIRGALNRILANAGLQEEVLEIDSQQTPPPPSEPEPAAATASESSATDASESDAAKTETGNGDEPKSSAELASPASS